MTVNHFLLCVLLLTCLWVSYLYVWFLLSLSVSSSAKSTDTAYVRCWVCQEQAGLTHMTVWNWELWNIGPSFLLVQEAGFRLIYMFFAVSKEMYAMQTLLNDRSSLVWSLIGHRKWQSRSRLEEKEHRCHPVKRIPAKWDWKGFGWRSSAY